MPTKPGYKTTEFWTTIAVQIILLLYGSGAISEGSHIDKGLTAVLHIAAAFGYQVQRTSVKKAAAASAPAPDDELQGTKL